MGDFGDYYATSRHPKDPNRPRNLEFEIDANKRALAQIDALGISRKHFLMGNHEANLSKFLMESAPQLFNMIRVEELLELKKHGWTWSAYGEIHKIGHMRFVHDLDYSGADAHTRTLRDMCHNVVIAHTHRMAIDYRRNLAGAQNVGAMFGWLGDERWAKYLKGARKRYWTHGFGIGYLDSSGIMHLQAVPFVNYSCIINGKLLFEPETKEDRKPLFHNANLAVA